MKNNKNTPREISYEELLAEPGVVIQIYRFLQMVKSLKAEGYDLSVNGEHIQFQYDSNRAPVYFKTLKEFDVFREAFTRGKIFGEQLANQNKISH